MKNKIKSFLITTKTVSRVLFFIWLFFIIIFLLANAFTFSELLASCVGLAPFFLIPTILIEYKKNPTLNREHRQAPFKRHFVFGIILMEISPFFIMSGILGVTYSEKNDWIPLLIPLVLGLTGFIFGILLVNGFITKQTINQVKQITISTQEKSVDDKQHPIRVKVHMSKRTHSCVPASNGSIPNVTASNPDTNDISIADGMEGHEFEYFCADLLRKNGFSSVSVTPGSGDQGVDVLATKAGIKYAIQCKCYLSPLGNKPIQEVNAGKMYYKCHVGVVMTNSTFTPGAMDLAEATNVLLWDRVTMQQMMNNL